MALQYTAEGGNIRITDGGAPVLAIQEGLPYPGEKKVLIALAGVLRSDVTGYVENELRSFMSLGADILVETQEVSYLSVAAQQCFLRAQQYADRIGRGTLTLHVPNETLYAQFAQTGITELLQIAR